jgi:hypothetical protein
MAVQCWSGTWPELVFLVGAGEGNRTLMTSLEGWGSTIELRPRSGQTATRSVPFLRHGVAFGMANGADPPHGRPASAIQTR